MAEPFYIIVDGGIFFDEGIGLRDVCFRLVVIIVRYKIADSIIRHQLAEFCAQLRCQGLIRFQDQRRPLQLFNKPCCCSGFTGTCSTQKDDIAFPIIEPLRKLINSFGLVAGRLIGGLDHKRPVLALDK